MLQPVLCVDACGLIRKTQRIGDLRKAVHLLYARADLLGLCTVIIFAGLIALVFFQRIVNFVIEHLIRAEAVIRKDRDAVVHKVLLDRGSTACTAAVAVIAFADDVLSRAEYLIDECGKIVRFGEEAFDGQPVIAEIIRIEVVHGGLIQPAAEFCIIRRGIMRAAHPLVRRIVKADHSGILRKLAAHGQRFHVPAGADRDFHSLPP